MKIKADSRGRVSLAQAGIGNPHQEWEVTQDSKGVHLSLPDQGASEWVEVHVLSADLIGKVVVVERLSADNRIDLQKIPPQKRPSAAGVLSSYQTDSQFDKYIEFHGGERLKIPALRGDFRLYVKKEDMR